MLAVLLNSSQNWAPSTWPVWIDTIMARSRELGIEKAAIIRKTGSVAASTPGYSWTQEQIVVSFLVLSHVIRQRLRWAVGTVCRHGLRETCIVMSAHKT